MLRFSIRQFPRIGHVGREIAEEGKTRIRDAKIFFGVRRHLSVVAADRLSKTHIRICIWASKGRREIATVPLSFCFHRQGNIGIGAGLLPLEPFWQRASWGRYTMTKKEERKKKGGIGDSVEKGPKFDRQKQTV